MWWHSKLCTQLFDTLFNAWSTSCFGTGVSATTCRTIGGCSRYVIAAICTQCKNSLNQKMPPQTKLMDPSICLFVRLILPSRTSYNTYYMHEQSTNHISLKNRSKSLEPLPEQQYSRCDSSEYQTPEAEANNCLVHSCMRWDSSGWWIWQQVVLTMKMNTCVLHWLQSLFHTQSFWAFYLQLFVWILVKQINLFCTLKLCWGDKVRLY